MSQGLDLDSLLHDLADIRRLGDNRQVIVEGDDGVWYDVGAISLFTHKGRPVVLIEMAGRIEW